MKQEVYYHGTPGKRYGVFDPATKSWKYGINEETPMLAMARLYQRVGAKAKHSGYEPRELPKRMVMA